MQPQLGVAWRKSCVASLSNKIWKGPYCVEDINENYTHFTQFLWTFKHPINTQKLTLRKKYSLQTFYCGGCISHPPFLCTHAFTQLSILQPLFPHGNLDELGMQLFFSSRPPWQTTLQSELIQFWRWERIVVDTNCPLLVTYLNLHVLGGPKKFLYAGPKRRNAGLEDEEGFPQFNYNYNSTKNNTGG